MASDVQSSEFEEFCDFLVHIRQQGVQGLSPERSVQEFRDYQDQLRQWQERNAVSAEQARRGEASALDDEVVLRRLRERLSKEGIVE